MKVEKLYQDFGIEYKTDGHKHCRPGWVNVPCPFCEGNPGYHLGFEIAQNYYYCWRCGPHSVPEVISTLTNTRYKEAYSIIRMYEGQSSIQTKRYKDKEEFSFPSDVTPLLEHHKQYIENRGYDVDEIERLFGVQSTGPMSKLDKISYKHRILIPIYWKGAVVSFQARDVTDKSNEKYMACPIHREREEHQNILYAAPHLLKRTGIIVEGPTDVWRLKESTVCTFGIQFTPRQVRNLALLFDKCIIIYDEEKQAQKQAKKLRKELLFRGVSTAIEHIDTDPGDLEQKEADYIVKQILK